MLDTASRTHGVSISEYEARINASNMLPQDVVGLAAMALATVASIASTPPGCADSAEIVDLAKLINALCDAYISGVQ